MKRVKKSAKKKSKPRHWYSFLWLLLPILVVTAAISVIFYYNIFPYSSRFNKLSNSKSPSDNAAKPGSDARKLTLKALNPAPIAGDESSSGTELQITLVNDRLEPVNADGDVILTLSGSNPSGTFVGGERQQITGGNSLVKVRYTNTHAGPVTLSAFVSGLKPVSAGLNFKPGPPAGISKILIDNTEKVSLQVDNEASFSASVIDKYGNLIPGQTITWSIPAQNYSLAVRQNATGRSIFNTVFTGKAPRSEIVQAKFGQINQNLSITIEP